MRDCARLPTHIEKERAVAWVSAERQERELTQLKGRALKGPEGKERETRPARLETERGLLG